LLLHPLDKDTKRYPFSFVLQQPYPAPPTACAFGHGKGSQLLSG